MYNYLRLLFIKDTLWILDLSNKAQKEGFISCKVQLVSKRHSVKPIIQTFEKKYWMKL